MNWFAYIGYSLLTVLSFTVIYFLYKEYTRFANRENSDKNYILTTVVFSWGIVLTQWLLTWSNLEPGITLSISLMYIFLIPIFFEKKSLYLLGPIAILGSFTTVNDFTNIDNYITTFQVTAIAFATLFILESNIFKSKNLQIIALTTFLVLSSFLGNLYLNQSNFDVYFWITATLSIVVFYTGFVYIQYFAINQINKAHSRLLKLEFSINKDDKNLVKTSIYKKQIKAFIDINKIKYGIYILFEIKNRKSSDYEENVKLIVEKITNIYPKAIFVNATSKNFAAFVPLNKISHNDLKTSIENNFITTRSRKDIFFGIQNVLNEFVSMNKQVKAIGTIYGVQSFDFNKLFDYAAHDIHETSLFETSPLYVFDFAKQQQFLRKKLQTYELTSDITFKINLVKSLNEDNIIYPTFLIKGNTAKKKFTFDEFLKGQNENDKNTLIRYFALETLKEFKDSKTASETKLLLPYNYEALTSFQNLKELFNKIQKYIPLSNVILAFNQEDAINLINDEYNLDLIKDNYIKLALYLDDKEAITDNRLLNTFNYIKIKKEHSYKVWNIKDNLNYLNIEKNQLDKMFI